MKYKIKKVFLHRSESVRVCAESKDDAIEKSKLLEDDDWEVDFVLLEDVYSARETEYRVTRFVQDPPDYIEVEANSQEEALEKAKKIPDIEWETHHRPIPSKSDGPMTQEEIDSYLDDTEYKSYEAERMDLKTKITLKDFLNKYDTILSMAALEIITGVNQKQLHHYKSGLSIPSQGTLEKVRKGIQEFAKDLYNSEIEYRQ